jgi:hypothetical protein
VCALLTTAVALAGPSAAIEDPRRPSAQVTHGPSCGPAVVRVAVTNGTLAHRVGLVFDGTEQHDAADVGPGERVELGSTDIAWGRTVDVTVTVAGLDGTAEEPIALGTYTRPSAEDCASVTPTTTTAAEPAQPDSTRTTPGSAPPPVTAPSTTEPGTTTPTPDTPRSGPPAPTSSSDAGPVDDQPDPRVGQQAGSASAASVAPGGVVTLRATGFTPGEPVIVSMLGVDDPLATVTAGGDGSVEAVVQIPRAAALGTATVRLVGGLSAAAAGLDLQVAARATSVAQRTTSVPVLAAGLSLIGAAAVLGLVAARRSGGSHTTMPR